MEKQDSNNVIQEIRQVIVDLKPIGLLCFAGSAAVGTIFSLGLKRRNSSINLLSTIPNTTALLFGTCFGFLFVKEFAQRKTQKYEMVEFSKLSGAASGAATFGLLGLAFKSSSKLLPLKTALAGAAFGYTYVWIQERYILWKYSNWKKKQQGEITSDEKEQKSIVKRFVEAVPDYFKDAEVEYAMKRRDELEFIKRELRKMELEETKANLSKKSDSKTD